MAQGETIAAATSAGTSAAISLKRFGHFNGTIKRDGVALGNIVSADVTYANNLDRIETIRSDARIDGADPTIAALTGKIDVRFADTTLMIQAINGSAATLEFSYAFSSGESLTLTAHAVYLPRPRIEIKGPKGVQASFDWQAALATSPARMSGWSLDATTGTVTFTTAPGNGVIVRAGFEFDVPVRFDTDMLDVTLDIERLGSITSIPLLEIRR